MTYYFSTHGWSLVVSFGGGALDDDAPLAAASLRAFRSKKLAIVIVLQQTVPLRYLYNVRCASCVSLKVVVEFVAS